ncbi:MAG: hypothetical protein OS112_00420 [Methanoregula sp.]|nr:MAG: hypothetical protein OS112_00420 [Methanoregula sp.]
MFPGNRRQDTDPFSCHGNDLPAAAGEVMEVRGVEAQETPAADGDKKLSREWYFRASAGFSSLVINHELERIITYALDVDTHAHNLGVLWKNEPFPTERFFQEAARIVERSDLVEENVVALKNAVVRFVRAGQPAQEHASRLSCRSHRSRWRVSHRYMAPALREGEGPGQPDGVGP